MKKLYQTNKDFKDYVDSYMRNKNVTLEEVLFLQADTACRGDVSGE